MADGTIGARRRKKVYFGLLALAASCGGKPIVAESRTQEGNSPTGGGGGAQTVSDGAVGMTAEAVDGPVGIDSSRSAADASTITAANDAAVAAFKPRFYVLEPDLNQPLSVAVTPLIGTTVVDLASRDGAVLVGETTVFRPDLTSESLGSETFLWTEAAGLKVLGFLAGDAGPAIGDPWMSSPYWVNSDGRVIFGKDSRGYFRWTKAAGLVGLGDLHEGPRVDLTVFSEDGKYAAAGVASETEVYRPARWDTVAGWQMLPPLPSGYNSEVPWSVSSSGEVILGDCLRYNDDSGYQSMGTLPDFPGGCFAYAPRLDGKIVFGWCADESPRRRAVFRWTEATGVQTIGVLATDPNTELGLVSSDGSTAVGLATTYTPTDFSIVHSTMYRWTTTSGIAPLDPPKGFTLDLVALSEDGRILVGNSSSEQRGYRWSQATGFVGVDSPDYSSSKVTGVTSDGSIAFGQVSRKVEGGLEEEAVLWDMAGSRYIRSELVEAGVDLKGTVLVTAERAWNNGAAIVVQGKGRNTLGQERAWVAVLPPRR